MAASSNSLFRFSSFSAVASISLSSVCFHLSILFATTERRDVDQMDAGASFRISVKEFTGVYKCTQDLTVNQWKSLHSTRVQE